MPTLRLAVKPSRIGFPLATTPDRSTCKTRPGAAHLRPAAATFRNSARRVSRAIGFATGTRLGRQALAPLGTPGGENFAPADGRKARAKAVAPLADELAGLIGALHGPDSGNDFPSKQRRCIREPCSQVNAAPRRSARRPVGNLTRR